MFSIPDSQLNPELFPQKSLSPDAKNGVYCIKTHFPLTTICVGVTPPFLSMSRWRGGTVSD